MCEPCKSVPLNSADVFVVPGDVIDSPDTAIQQATPCHNRVVKWNDAHYSLTGFATASQLAFAAALAQVCLAAQQGATVTAVLRDNLFPARHGERRLRGRNCLRWDRT